MFTLSSFTGFCPAAIVFRKLGIPAGCAFNPRCPQAFERCRSERPELMAAGATRAACWRVEESKAVLA